MATSSNTRVWSDLAVPPGELLAEELDARGMTQRELAERTGRPEQKISEIINGKKAITQDTALELEKVLGTPAHIWLNLESTYRLTLARQRETLELEKQLDWLDQFPIGEMQKRNLIPKSESKIDRLRSVLRFFGVASFPALRERQTAILGYRVTPGAKVNEGALWVWLREGEIGADHVSTAPYDEGKFRAALSQIRGLTREPPSVFYPHAQSLCAEAGVAFLIVQQFPGSGASGVARWLSQEKALLQLSTRYRWVDVLWFSFFHEACHVLERQKRRVFVNGVNDDPAAEREADRFAQDFLIPDDDWQGFVRLGDFSRNGILQFAERLGVAAAIVVGRMQHSRLIPQSHFNDIRPRLVWGDS